MDLTTVLDGHSTALSSVHSMLVLFGHLLSHEHISHMLINILPGARGAITQGRADLSFHPIRTLAQVHLDQRAGGLAVKVCGFESLSGRLR